MKHSLSKIHQIIHSTKCCQVDSINSSKEHLEIKVNSSAADEIFNEVENNLVNEVDEVLLKPIQRFPYTSELAKEYFKKGLKERSIDMLRDDSKIYIVGHSAQKDYINKGIEEINRVTVTKIIKIDGKWKIEAIKTFALIDKLTETFPDILARIQPGRSSIFLQGKDVTIEKAENEMKNLLSNLFNQNIQLDPLVLQLLTCKQASEMLTFDEVSCEIQKISQENKEIKRKSEGLELRCKKSEDRCNALEKELRSEEEKYKRLAFENHVLEETNRDRNSETTKQLKDLRDLCYVHKSKTESQQNEIGCLKTTNKNLVDNLRFVNDELRSQLIDKTKQEDRYKQKISNTDTAVNIKAKLKISANVFLVESTHIIKQIIENQFGVDVLNGDNGATTLVGDLRSISLALDKFLKWTNEISDVKSAADTIGKDGPKKDELPRSGNQTICEFHHTFDEDIIHEPNQIQDVERQITRDPKSSSQKSVPAVGGKSNNVPGASGGYQSPRHKMYPALIIESGHMIEEQNMPPKEHISTSPDPFKEFKSFPIIDEDSLMMTTKEGIKVYVYQGNLCYLNVQGIVNSANENMNASYGLFSVVAKEAGEKMIRECQSYLAYYTKLHQGKVCVTTAGNLNKYISILHVYVPVWDRRKDIESYIEGLMNVIRTAMIAADDIKLKSIAISAIGSVKTTENARPKKIKSKQDIYRLGGEVLEGDDQNED
ncbi:Hypothetical predicted protein [Mytilus galloprovincialis]|uniref:Macro domain-containing protein n=1 Tax=Mytilus galloprovincialis TaxID=29158 RepID=A0A8B6GW07_MYTGA|nr:Hypothetical predicted protein [Mytilus galloprovincialis]